MARIGAEMIFSIPMPSSVHSNMLVEYVSRQGSVIMHWQHENLILKFVSKLRKSRGMVNIFGISHKIPGRLKKYEKNIEVTYTGDITYPH